MGISNCFWRFLLTVYTMLPMENFNLKRPKKKKKKKEFGISAYGKTKTFNYVRSCRSLNEKNAVLGLVEF